MCTEKGGAKNGTLRLTGVNWFRHVKKKRPVTGGATESRTKPIAPLENRDTGTGKASWKDVKRGKKGTENCGPCWGQVQPVWGGNH